MEKLLEGLKFTCKVLPQFVICLKSLFSVTAAEFGLSTMMYKVVSSAKTDAFISLTMSLMYTRNISGPKTESWGTPAFTNAQSDAWPLRITR